jgi:hypothetical protein
MPRQDFVKVISSPGKWTVRLVEGGEMREREFERENHALAWAAGQRIRLNLPNIPNPFPDQTQRE